MEATDLPTAVRTALATAGLPAMPEETDRLAAFLDLLLAWNARLNLTRVASRADAIERHIVEPLAGWERLRPRLAAGAAVEVGSGGGAPGLPIAVVASDRPVVLVEARARKAAYLQTIVAELGLSNVTVEHTRAEAYGRSTARETAALALARALAPLPEALELLLPLVRVGGLVAVYAGPAAQASLPRAADLAARAGGAPPVVEALTWPGATRSLSLITVEKRAPTPSPFPRRPAARTRPARHRP